MIPDRNFLRRCAQKNNLELPRELEDWLLVHFEDEPYENFNTASILEDMVCMYCQSFAYGRLDVTIPDPITRLKERYDDLKDLITDLRVDMALRLFLVFLLFSPVFLISSPVYLEELLSFLVSPQSFSLSWCPPGFSGVLLCSLVSFIPVTRSS